MSKCWYWQVQMAGLQFPGAHLHGQAAGSLRVWGPTGMARRLGSLSVQTGGEPVEGAKFVDPPSGGPSSHQCCGTICTTQPSTPQSEEGVNSEGKGQTLEAGHVKSKGQEDPMHACVRMCICVLAHTHAHMRAHSQVCARTHTR